MPFYEKGDVRIRYEETGSGFPLLVTPGGGLNSRVSNWPTAVFNAMEVFKDDFRCITMDQRNANGGESTGPIAVEDQLGERSLEDQLGLRWIICRIRSGSFLWATASGGVSRWKLLMERAPRIAWLCGRAVPDGRSTGMTIRTSCIARGGMSGRAGVDGAAWLRM